MISYAQNFEDVMLWRALKNVHEGFYIDIGAQDPVVDSVSLAFYEKGWRGLHLEPNKYYADLLRTSRPGEVVKQLIVADHEGKIPFYEIYGTGLSTANSNIAQLHKSNGYEIIETIVETVSLDCLLDKFSEKIVHWLKIDVEGFEKSVLDSWKNSKCRPWIILIESTRPLTQDVSYSEWEPILLAKDYQFVYFDGLNRFYVHKQHKELFQYFKTPVNVFDNFALSGLSSHSFHKHLSMKAQESEAKAQAQIEVMKAQESEAKAQAQIEVMKVDLANLQQLNHHHWALAGERQIKIDAIYSSTSWRITFPMRWIVNKWRMFNLSDFKQTIKRNIKTFLYSLILRKPKSTDYFPDNTGDVEALPNSKKEMKSPSIMMSPQAERIYQYLKFSIEKRKKD